MVAIRNTVLMLFVGIIALYRENTRISKHTAGKNKSYWIFKPMTCGINW